MEIDFKKRKYVYIIYIILGLFFLYSLIMIILQRNEENNQILKGEKTLGHYKILKTYGPNPFKVDLLEIETNKIIKDVFISEACPDFNNINTSKTYQLFRYTNMQVKTGIQTYSYEGLYEAVCTKIKREINEDK
jgi:hypothetical protein